MDVDELDWKVEGILHEVTVGYPRHLRGGPQGVADDVQAGRERGLVYECQKVDARAGEEYLPWSVSLGLLVSVHVFLFQVVCHAVEVGTSYRDNGSLWNIVGLLIELVGLGVIRRFARHNIGLLG